MSGMTIFAAGLLLLMVQSVERVHGADLNGSAIIKTSSGGDLADEASAILAEVLANRQGKLSSFIPDAKTARFLKLYNSVGDKRNPNIYSFGLGKRSGNSNQLNPYSFGLGKRASSGLNPYSFGLGKRTTPGIYSFGLGKRSDRDDEVWKRNGNRFGFGLGKRNSIDDDSDQQLMDEDYWPEPTDDDVEEEDQQSEGLADYEELSVNKRNPDAKRERAFFPSHLRSAFMGNPQLTNLGSLVRRPGGINTLRSQSIYQPVNDFPNPGKRLPVYNFGLGK